MGGIYTFRHSQFFRQQRVHAISENDRFRFNNVAIRLNAHHFAVALNKIIHADAGYQLRARLFSLFHQPGVKFTAQYGIRDLRRRGILAIDVIHRHRPFFGHKSEFFHG
ncbi:Uncharacterised protein [Citrobacter koseri]|uniref:Uncharacterized protein n=1 Tax=Citrobacter koseri TaxID=545 RepID=A0A3S4IGQ5_CITKO|nr:Uncharacterised protein [Citrobacter koseri]